MTTKKMQKLAEAHQKFAREEAKIKNQISSIHYQVGVIRGKKGFYGELPGLPPTLSSGQLTQNKGWVVTTVRGVRASYLTESLFLRAEEEGVWFQNLTYVRDANLKVRLGKAETVFISKKWLTASVHNVSRWTRELIQDVRDEEARKEAEEELQIAVDALLAQVRTGIKAEGLRVEEVKAALEELTEVRLRLSASLDAAKGPVKPRWNRK